MSRLTSSVGNLRQLDEIAGQKTWIHQLHPLTKLLTTLLFLITAASFERDEISSLLPLLLYPVLIFSLAEIPAWLIIKRVLLVEPLIIGIGILNPILDDKILIIGNFSLSHGWLTLGSILLKSVLTITAALLLIASTGINHMAAAMRQLKIPRLLVTLIILIYRYLAVLAEEVSRTLRAYALRSPNHPGIKFQSWGSLTGQLLLRSFDRADRLYRAMILRGFSGEYHTGITVKTSFRDAAYLLGWLSFFCLVRLFDLPALAGTLITGVLP